MQSSTVIQGGSVVRCIAVSWCQVFIGTAAGRVFRWNYTASSSAVNAIEGFTGPIDFLVCNKEGSRKVLVIGGRQNAIIIRDAFSGK